MANNRKIIDTHDRTYNYWWDNGQLYGARKTTPNKAFKIDSELAKQRLQAYVTGMGIDTQPKREKSFFPMQYERVQMPKVNLQQNKAVNRKRIIKTQTKPYKDTTDEVPERVKSYMKQYNDMVRARQQEEAEKEQQRSEQSRQITKNTLNGISKFVSNISSALGSVDKKISDTYDNVTNKVNKKVDDLSTAAKEKMAVIKERLGDAYNVIAENKNNPQNLINTIENEIRKQFQEGSVVKSNIKKINVKQNDKKQNVPFNKHYTVTETLDPKFAASTRQGTDTLWWKNESVDRTKTKYAIEESFPITDRMKWGHRNRGDVNEANSQRMPITTYRPFEKFENTKIGEIDGEGRVNYFIGYDSRGNFKLGPKSQFKRGDTMTQIFYDDLTDIPRDKKGNFFYKKFEGDSRRSNIIFNGYGEEKLGSDGKTLPRQRDKRSFTMSTDVHKKNTNRFGNVVGGAVLVQCGSETRVIRGSIDFCVNEVEQMQKNHRGKPVRVFQLDNGSYNRGLRTKSKTITKTDWEDYDAQNTARAGGGHGMYIINNR